MRKHLTAGIVSLGIAFAGVTAPTPSQADSRDVALIIGSAIALFALKEALADNSKPNKTKKPNTSKYKYWQANRLVPGQCFYRYSGRGGMQGVFGERCIASVTGSARYLPNSCRRSEGNQFKRAPAYDAACLRSRGYRVEARRH